MPTLPSADQIRLSTPQAATGIVSVDATAVPSALARTGQVIERTAERVQNYLDRTAELHANDALIELKRRQNQLTVGENGYARLQNGAATEEGVYNKYTGMFDRETADLASKLSPQARRKFEMGAKQQRTQYEAGFLTHVMREDLNHRGEVYKANIAVAGETMGLNFNNPEAIIRERASIDRTVAQYVADNGIKDQAIIERMLQDARGIGHRSVIEAYVENGQASDAEAYYKAFKQEMLPETAKSIQNMLKPEVANQVGRDLSDKLFQMHMDGKSEVEIFNEKLRMTEGRGREVIQATDALYAARVKALEVDRAKIGGDLLVGAWNGSTSFNDPRLREIDASDPVLGAQLRQQIFAIQKRNAGVGGGVEARVPTQVAMAEYAELVEAIRTTDNPEDKALVTSAIVNSGSLTRAEVKQLLAMQSRVEQDADKAMSAASRARIPAALVNASMPKSADNTERKTAYRGFVEQKLFEWKEANPGRVPDYREQQAILASAAEEHVVVGRVWNSEREAYRLASGVKSYPRSFANMLPGRDDDDILEAYAYVQNFKAKLPKGAPVPSDAELIVRWERVRRGPERTGLHQLIPK